MVSTAFQDRFEQVRANLRCQWGELNISPADANGSVRIVAADTGRSFRFTSQGRLIPEPPSKWGCGRNRS